MLATVAGVGHPRGRVVAGVALRVCLVGAMLPLQRLVHRRNRHISDTRQVTGGRRTQGKGWGR